MQISVERMGKNQGAPEGQLDLPEVGAAYLCEQRGQCERDKAKRERPSYGGPAKAQRSGFRGERRRSARGNEVTDKVPLGCEMSETCPKGGASDMELAPTP